MPSKQHDPIFAAIDTHRAQWATYAAASAAAENARFMAPRDVARRAARDLYWEQTYDFAAVEPTTQAGLLALLQYVAGFRGLPGRTVWADPEAPAMFDELMPTIATAFERLSAPRPARRRVKADAVPAFSPAAH